MRWILLLSLPLLLWAPIARAIDVGSDGSDGALNMINHMNIDLSLAKTANGADSVGTGNGVYFPDRWAVVFKYTSVSIASGRVLTFTNHPSGAPVVWLVQGDVTLASGSAINVSGQTISQDGFRLGGPGGFRGGRAGGTIPGSGGLGPGGGGYNPTGAAGYGTPGAGTGGGTAYGNARVIPLIGGSGSGGQSTASGCGGGGAILIAANGTINVEGGISANATSGGPTNGGGAGGGIRLVADSITGLAQTLTANGYQGGGVGRIRLETNNLTITGDSSPPYSFVIRLDPDDLRIWPPSSYPTIRVTTVGDQPVPADPRARFVPPGDVFLVSSDSVTVELEGRNIPVDPSRRWNVTVRMVPRSGSPVFVPATLAAGDSIASVWSAKLPPLPDQDYVGIQARAYKP
jgi:hypothetical protein